METKNLKSIEWHYNNTDNNVRLRITTKETAHPRIFVVYSTPKINAYPYGMDVYNDWAYLESSDCYKSLISVFTAIAEILDCEFAELADTMVEIDKLLS